MIVPTPSVAITEFTLSFVTINPLTTPTSAPSAEHDGDSEADGQLVVHDESGHQHAMQARGIANREVKLADDHRKGEPARDDHGERGLIEHIDEIVEGRKRLGRQDRKDHDHHGKPEDRRIAGENRETRPG